MKVSTDPCEPTVDPGGFVLIPDAHRDVWESACGYGGAVAEAGRGAISPHRQEGLADATACLLSDEDECGTDVTAIEAAYGWADEAAAWARRRDRGDYGCRLCGSCGHTIDGLCPHCDERQRRRAA